MMVMTMSNQYRHRVRYNDPGTGQEMFTGLCRDLNDAMLKAAFLGGTVIDEDEGVVWSRENEKAQQTLS
jgi:hypothetical protein